MKQSIPASTPTQSEESSPTLNNVQDELNWDVGEIVTTIYSLDLKEYEEARIDVIPFYSRGEIKHLTEETVNSFLEGHHPWLGHAETFVATQVSNLVPPEYKKDDDIKKEFIKLKNMSESGASAIIMLGDNYYYEVTLESSESTGGIFFITNIVLHITLEAK
ncbi:hypothetical protein [Paenibacillus segetis]|uniref:Uncharacterized protein n=1 Tax=Paenibacillus segetis TaxID=1325360 RepID=A0ABQ1Y998_9BACL|nr:hypothetical protein [Paenibacillus segetis]GGH16128.1 hypothetical protein GCM10008013_10720 [Paenibacillus segetis]